MWCQRCVSFYLCFVPDLLTAGAKFSPGHELNSSEFWVNQSISLRTENSTTLGHFSSLIFAIFLSPIGQSGSSLLAQLPCPSTHQSLPEYWNRSPLPVTSCQWMFFIKQTPASIRLNKTRFIKNKQGKTERKSK